METILKYEKILALFYNDKKAAIHLRGIARASKLNENSATRFLKKLENMHIVNSRKDGNLKKFNIELNNTTFTIFEYFDIRRFNALPSTRKNAVSYFIEKLVEKPIIILLFGSTAKNTFSINSDIDLLIIINSKISTNEAVKFAESQTGIKINCIQITYSEFLKELKLKNDKVVQSAISTGYPVFNNRQYYHEVYNERI